LNHTPDPAAFIRASLPARPVPGVPEIVIHTAAPESRLGRLVENSLACSPPYWAYPWAGGIALARFVLDVPETVRGLRVLDIGSGSGLVAIAAAKAGAATVLAAEIDPNGRAAQRLNAELNGVAIDGTAADLLDGPPPVDTDLVIAGDVFYAADLARRSADFFERCAEMGIPVLIGDPGRAFLPRERLLALAEYPVADFGEDAVGRGFVYAWRI